MTFTPQMINLYNTRGDNYSDAGGYMHVVKVLAGTGQRPTPWMEELG